MQHTEPSSNPYAAPQAPLAMAAADPRSLAQRIVDEWRRGAWPLVFMLNLGVPVILGFGLCNNTGFCGVVLTVFLLLMLTTWIVSSDQLLRLRWLGGGKIVGVMQAFPVIHFLIGQLSIVLLVHWGLVTDLTKYDDVPQYAPIDFLPACLLTLMVGGGLLGLAYLIGHWRITRAEEARILAPAGEND